MENGWKIPVCWIEFHILHIITEKLYIFSSISPTRLPIFSRSISRMRMKMGSWPCHVEARWLSLEGWFIVRGEPRRGGRVQTTCVLSSSPRLWGGLGKPGRNCALGEEKRGRGGEESSRGLIYPRRAWNHGSFDEWEESGNITLLPGSRGVSLFVSEWDGFLTREN